MAVMGGIIGAGIFINPYLVAERVHTPALISAKVHPLVIADREALRVRHTGKVHRSDCTD
jgi:hypothetical protein